MQSPPRPAGGVSKTKPRIFWDQCYGSSDLRCIDFDWKRINEIAQIRGEEETNKAVRKGYEEAAQDFERSDWIVFRYGTEEERTAYQGKGGQCLSDFECGVAEEIACKVRLVKGRFSMRKTSGKLFGCGTGWEDDKGKSK
jgi:hypothetical protein